MEDGLISEAGDPACKAAKPRRLPSTRRAGLRPQDLDLDRCLVLLREKGMVTGEVRDGMRID